MLFDRLFTPLESEAKKLEGDEVTELFTPLESEAKKSEAKELTGKWWTAPNFPEAILVENYAAILGSSRVA